MTDPIRPVSFVLTCDEVAALARRCGLSDATMLLDLPMPGESEADAGRRSLRARRLLGPDDEPGDVVRLFVGTAAAAELRCSIADTRDGRVPISTWAIGPETAIVGVWIGDGLYEIAIGEAEMARAALVGLVEELAGSPELSATQLAGQGGSAPNVVAIEASAGRDDRLELCDLVVLELDGAVGLGTDDGPVSATAALSGLLQLIAGTSVTAQRTSVT